METTSTRCSEQVFCALYLHTYSYFISIIYLSDGPICNSPFGQNEGVIDSSEDDDISTGSLELIQASHKAGKMGLARVEIRDGCEPRRNSSA